MRYQSISEYLSLNSSGSLFAASPIISKFRITASTVLLSPTNCSNDNECVYSKILAPLSIMSSTKRCGWRLDIDNFRLYLVKIFTFYAISRNKIHSPVEGLFQIIGEVYKLN